MRDERVSPLPWAALLPILAVKIGLPLAVADRYGWHRDELYYLASSQHPALGYVDYPPITPMLGALDQLIFPRSLPGLRLLPILAGAAVTVIAVLIAQRLGGSRLAQVLTALAVLISPMFVGTNILFQTVSFDEVTWALTMLLFVRLLTGANPREWLLLGLVFGIGLETKYTIIGLGVGLLIALLATPQRRLLRTPWPWYALVIAFLVMVPNLTWQVTHHWDSVAYTVNHRGATDGPVLYWLEQILLAGPLELPIVVIGTVWLWRRPDVRPLAVLIVAVELVFFAAGGKAYYPAPIYPLAYAAGSIWFLDKIRRPIIRWSLVALASAVTLVLLPVGLPVIPAKNLPTSDFQARKDFADMIGWPDLTRQVTRVYDNLPPDERTSTMIMTDNYGEAGALQYYGHNLPPVVCPELTFYYWAPASMAPSTIIVVGSPRDYLASFFGNDITQVGSVTNDLGLHNEEWGKPIWIIRHPRQSLSQAWPQLKSLD